MRTEICRWGRVLSVLALATSPLFGCSDDDGEPSPDAAIQADVAAGATVSGTVESFGATGLVPLGGATVTQLDTTPANTAVSDAEGLFAISVTPDEAALLEFTATAHLPVRAALVAPEAGVSDLSVSMLSPIILNFLLTDLELELQEAGKGIVLVGFEGQTDTGGEKASLNLTHGDVVTVDGDNSPVVSDALIADGTGVLAFANVEPGSATVTLEATTGSCALAYPSITEYEVLADTITLILVACSQ